MASWRNIKWDGNEKLDELSYRLTQLGKALDLNDQHILDTFKLGLSAHVYVNVAHIDGMQVTLNMAKDLQLVQKELYQVQVPYQTFHLWQLQVMMCWVYIKSLTYPNR